MPDESFSDAASRLGVRVIGFTTAHRLPVRSFSDLVGDRGEARRNAYLTAENKGALARKNGAPASRNPYDARKAAPWFNAWRRGWERG